MRSKFVFMSTVVLVLMLTFITSGWCADEQSSPAAGEAPAPEGRDAPWEPPGEAAAVKPPLIVKLAEGVLKVGEVTVNKPQSFVSVEGAVNMADGLVEYLACGPMGKLHESVLVLNAQPYHLQVALLLLGLEPGNKPLDRQGGMGEPVGDPVEIWVTWRSSEGKKIRSRAEALVFNVNKKKAMQETHWVFTGSQVIEGRFMAQIEHSIVATYHDPFAMFDHPLATGTDDTLYIANKDTLPPKGTPVTLLIKPLEAKKTSTP